MSRRTNDYPDKRARQLSDPTKQLVRPPVPAMAAVSKHSARACPSYVCGYCVCWAACGPRPYAVTCRGNLIAKYCARTAEKKWRDLLAQNEAIMLDNTDAFVDIAGSAWSLLYRHTKDTVFCLS